MTNPSPNLFVIGTASLDVLHLVSGQVARTAGGAGLYTALAAQKSGTVTGLFAPKPTELPDPLQPADRLLHWLGPAIDPDELPRLEIAHHGQGRATLLNASWGAEAQLIPAVMPALVRQTAVVHIAALSSAERQLAFLRALKPHSRVSVGTYARLVTSQTAQVRELLEQADFFFMNENEARGLFGSIEQARSRPGALLFVTLDAAGALVIEGDSATHVAGTPVPEVDPTGAGDTFCGATLAGLMQGLSAVAAARQAVKLAAQTVSAIGPAALLANA